MKKKKALLITLSVIWVMLMAGLGVFFVFFTSGKGTYDKDEKRMLADAPELSAENVWNGTFSTESENYLSDHSPGRKEAIRFTSELKDKVGVATYKDSLAVMDKKDEALSSSDLSGLDLDEMANQAKKKPKTEGMHRQKPEASPDDYPDTLYLTLNMDGESLPYYVYDKVNVLAMTSVLNRIAACLPEDGELVYTMVPQASVGNMYNEAEVKEGFVSDMEPMINALADSNVQAVSTAEILGAAMERGEYVYFRSDMHWSVPGTYLVYQEMMKLIGQTPAKWNTYYDKVEYPFLGTYYRDYPASYMEENPDRLDLIRPFDRIEWRRIDGPNMKYHLIDFLDFNADPSDRYTVFLGGPGGPWTYAKIDNGIERRCLVISDSFGLGFVPLVAKNYGEVHYYDPRYFDKETVGASVKEMIQKNNISDVFVVIGDLHSYDNDFILSQVSSQLGDE